MSNTSVVIPIYRDKLTPAEQFSYRRTIDLLGKKTNISLVVPEGLDTNGFLSQYEIGSEEVTFETFPDYYFKSVWSYNLLLTDVSFYTRFQNYDYLLITQLDALVLSDKIEEWVSSGFIYVGAPWLSDDDRATRGLVLGNGGFSLRRREVFYQLTKSSSSRLRSFLYDISHSHKVLKAMALAILLPYFIAKAMFCRDYSPSLEYGVLLRTNEDILFSRLLKKGPYKLPSLQDAARFSFETNPSQCMSLTFGELPFGCHAWEKWDRAFWERHYPVLKDVPI